VEEGQDAIHDPLRHGRDLEALGQHASQLRQLLGLTPPTRRFRIESRVLEGDGRLVRERLGELDFARPVHAARAIPDRQGPNQPVVNEQRHGEDGPIGRTVEARPPLRGQLDARVVHHIAGGDGAPFLHGESQHP